MVNTRTFNLVPLFIVSVFHVFSYEIEQFISISINRLPCLIVYALGNIVIFNIARNIFSNKIGLKINEIANVVAHCMCDVIWILCIGNCLFVIVSDKCLCIQCVLWHRFIQQAAIKTEKKSFSAIVIHSTLCLCKLYWIVSFVLLNNFGFCYLQRAIKKGEAALHSHTHRERKWQSYRQCILICPRIIWCIEKR